MKIDLSWLTGIKRQNKYILSWIELMVVCMRNDEDD